MALGALSSLVAIGAGIGCGFAPSSQAGPECSTWYAAYMFYARQSLSIWQSGSGGTVAGNSTRHCMMNNAALRDTL